MLCIEEWNLERTWRNTPPLLPRKEEINKNKIKHIKIKIKLKIKNENKINKNKIK
jgi:hypothetical protein